MFSQSLIVCMLKQSVGAEAAMPHGRIFYFNQFSLLTIAHYGPAAVVGGIWKHLLGESSTPPEDTLFPLNHLAIYKCTSHTYTSGVSVIFCLSIFPWFIILHGASPRCACRPTSWASVSRGEGEQAARVRVELLENVAFGNNCRHRGGENDTLVDL